MGFIELTFSTHPPRNSFGVYLHRVDLGQEIAPAFHDQFMINRSFTKAADNLDERTEGYNQSARRRDTTRHPARKFYERRRSTYHLHDIENEIDIVKPSCAPPMVPRRNFRRPTDDPSVSF